MNTDDNMLDALALIEFADREDAESLRALLDRSDLREMVHGLAGLALTWGTDLAERQGYRSLIPQPSLLNRCRPASCTSVRLVDAAATWPMPDDRARTAT